MHNGTVPGPTKHLDKLSAPQFLETPEPLPIPDWKRPRLGEYDTGIVVPDVRKVTEADFPDLAAWLLPRLVDKYPRATPAGLQGWFQTLMVDPSFIFLRHKNAVLLMEAIRTPLEPQPRVSEHFLRLRSLKSDPTDIRREAYDQGLALYRMALGWAKGIQAVQFTYGIDSDISIANMYDAVPGAKKRDYYSATFGG